MASYQNSQPGQPTTTTTTTTTQITPLIVFDKNYVNSNTGLLKMVVIIIDLAGFIIAQFGPQTGKVSFYCITAMSAFWISLLLFGMYAFHIVERLYKLHWLLGEFGFSLVWTMFFFVSSLLMIMSGGVQTLAAIFGFISCGLYGYDAKVNYERYSRGEIAQGERITPQTMA